MAETGTAGIAFPAWQAILAPPKTPREIANRLSRAVAEVLRNPEVRAQYERQASEAAASTPEELTSTIAETLEVWRVFIRENNIPQE